MENQHRKITGYRELTQDEIDFVNRIKEEGESLRILVADVQKFIDEREYAPVPLSEEPARWAAMGGTNLQTGLMYLTRAVARPESF